MQRYRCDENERHRSIDRRPVAATSPRLIIFDVHIECGQDTQCDAATGNAVAAAARGIFDDHAAVRNEDETLSIAAGVMRNKTDKAPCSASRLC